MALILANSRSAMAIAPDRQVGYNGLNSKEIPNAKKSRKSGPRRSHVRRNMTDLRHAEQHIDPTESGAPRIAA